jgi:hypothetical protein
MNQGPELLKNFVLGPVRGVLKLKYIQWWIELCSLFIYIENVQLKVTKSNVLSVDLAIFDCYLA